MLILGQDIISHNVMPLLNLKDILSLSLVSKQMQTLVENSDDWDRRYYEDFPFDARRLDGNGFERYSRRCRARTVLDPSYNWSCSVLEDPAILDRIASEPIVDILYYLFPTGYWRDLIDGVLVRRLDNSVDVYTSLTTLNFKFDTRDVSRLHCFYFKRMDSHSDTSEFILTPEIWGWKDGELVYYALDQLAEDLFDHGDEEAPRIVVEERKSVALEPSPVLLTGRDLDLFTEWDTWPDAHIPRRFGEPPSSLNYYYTRLNYEMEKHNRVRGVCYGDLVARFLKEFPIHLDIVVPSVMVPGSTSVLRKQYYQPLAVAASAGCSIFILGHDYQKYTFTLPHKIVTLIAAGCLCALDEKGNVYTGSLFMKDGLVVVSEPKIVLQHALKLVGTHAFYTYCAVKALMLDGTVKDVCDSENDDHVKVCVEADGSAGRDIGVKNAVLIDSAMSLVVD